MIDPHVHLRDWKQNEKETVKHGLEVAYQAGLDGVFEMPNTDPALTSRLIIERRIELADRAIYELDVPIFHGVYAGITANPHQIEEVVQAYQDLFPRVVGLKMFAGHSTGNMGIIEEKEQRLVYHTLADLGFKGVLAVHCEKEGLIDNSYWNPEKPITHCVARPPQAEVQSGIDMFQFAQEADYQGTLHVCHISVPELLDIIEMVRPEVGFKITTGVTPHHAELYDKMMEKEDGILKKMNPPLRSRNMQGELYQALLDSRIDWVETDHAPHTLVDKVEGHASGIPGLSYYPHFVRDLRKNLVDDAIDDLTHHNIVNTFGVRIPNTRRQPNYDLAKEYEFNAFD